MAKLPETIRKELIAKALESPEKWKGTIEYAEVIKTFLASGYGVNRARRWVADWVDNDMMIMIKLPIQTERYNAWARYTFPETHDTFIASKQTMLPVEV